MAFLMHIDDHRLYVPDDSLHVVKTEILAAVHAGGAFIDIRDSVSGVLEVLITPATSVRIQQHPEAVDDVDDASFSDMSFLDLEGYATHDSGL